MDLVATIDAANGVLDASTPKLQDGLVLIPLAAFGLNFALVFFRAPIIRAQEEVNAIIAARAPPPVVDGLQTYVRRPELEDALESFLRKPITGGGTYMVVVGARGAGKTTLVKHVLSKVGNGVLLVPIGKVSSTEADLDAHIMQAALDEYAPQVKSPFAFSEPMKPCNLAKRLASAAGARGEGWRPTIVIDMTSSGDSALIKAVCARLKLIAHDEPLCHGILVLSRAFAVAELTDDATRQTFLRVGSFSRDEASAHLDANFKALVTKEVATVAAVAAVEERIFPLTTLPTFMNSVVTKLVGSTSEAEFVARAEAWASDFEAKAREDVRGALAVVVRVDDGVEKDKPLPMRNLMRELVNADAPVKLPTAKYNVSAKQFASKIRESDEAKATFHVDLVAKTVEFASSAHRSAAAELLSGSDA
jgi:hypothetical protein